MGNAYAPSHVFNSASPVRLVKSQPAHYTPWDAVKAHPLQTECSTATPASALLLLLLLSRMCCSANTAAHPQNVLLQTCSTTRLQLYCGCPQQPRTHDSNHPHTAVWVCHTDTMHCSPHTSLILLQVVKGAHASSTSFVQPAPSSSSSSSYVHHTHNMLHA